MKRALYILIVIFVIASFSSAVLADEGISCGVGETTVTIITGDIRSIECWDEPQITAGYAAAEEYLFALTGGECNRLESTNIPWIAEHNNQLTHLVDTVIGWADAPGQSAPDIMYAVVDGLYYRTLSNPYLRLNFRDSMQDVLDGLMKAYESFDITTIMGACAQLADQATYEIIPMCFEGQVSYLTANGKFGCRAA